MLFLVDAIYSLRVNLPVQPPIILSMNKLYFDSVLNKIKSKAFKSKLTEI